MSKFKQIRRPTQLYTLPQEELLQKIGKKQGIGGKSQLLKNIFVIDSYSL